MLVRRMIGAFPFTLFFLSFPDLKDKAELFIKTVSVGEIELTRDSHRDLLVLFSIRWQLIKSRMPVIMMDLSLIVAIRWFGIAHSCRKKKVIIPYSP